MRIDDINQDQDLDLKRVKGMEILGKSLLIGILTGLVISGYRLLGSRLGDLFQEVYLWFSQRPLYFILLALILVVLAIFVDFLVRGEPMISGSGIPQMEGILHKKIHYNWFKVLLYKFVGGIICLAVGMSVGREGPSVQMGACLGQGVSERNKDSRKLDNYLITAGGSAGLSAAFGAPLAGVCFALEEAHKNFSYYVLLGCMLSSVVADFITKIVFGMEPSLQFRELDLLPLENYWAFVLLGLAVGVSGVIFNQGILRTKAFIGRQKLPSFVPMALAFLLSAGVSIYLPVLAGGGHQTIMALKSGDFAILFLLFLLLVKYIFTFVCFGSNVPGGIFFPLLAIGALVGSIMGKIFIGLGVDQSFYLNFVVLAMAGHFAAIVKAPLTGLILIFEMTGSMSQFLGLALVVLVATVTADLLKGEPIYDELLKAILKKKGQLGASYYEENFLKITVHTGSLCSNQRVMDLDFPSYVWITELQRGKHRILPTGSTVLQAGDLLIFATDEGHYHDAEKILGEMTRERP